MPVSKACQPNLHRHLRGPPPMDTPSFYELLAVAPDATPTQISAAYRRKALEHHPDKNPDRPDAAARFHELKRAQLALLDPAARHAYDNVLRLRQARLQREHECDTKRRSMRDDLLAREREYKRQKDAQDEAEARLQQEIERVRQEAAKRERASAVTESLRIRVKARSGRIVREELEGAVQRYGAVVALSLGKSQSTAVVEFASAASVQDILQARYDDVLLHDFDFEPLGAEGGVPQHAGHRVSLSGLETVTAMRLRQAAERKRVIAELEKDG